MHKPMYSIVAMLISIALASPAAAQGRGGGPKTQPVKTTGAMHGSPKPTSVKASPAPKAHGGSTSHAPKTTAHAAKPPKATTASTTKAASNSKTSKAPTTAATPATIAPTTTVTLTPVQQKLQRNTNLANKLESRLPKGTDVMLAAEGFRNLGQFVAAVNVSNNLNIPFADLKASMVDDRLSLGQSIKELRPLADANREASRAETQATTLINSTTTATPAATSTKAKKNTGASQN